MSWVLITGVPRGQRLHGCGCVSSLRCAVYMACGSPLKSRVLGRFNHCCQKLIKCLCCHHYSCISFMPSHPIVPTFFLCYLRSTTMLPTDKIQRWSWTLNRIEWLSFDGSRVNCQCNHLQFTSIKSYLAVAKTQSQLLHSLLHPVYGRLFATTHCLTTTSIESHDIILGKMLLFPFVVIHSKISHYQTKQPFKFYDILN